MGAIRGVLLVFVCVVLFLSLFVGNILLTLSSSLKYHNLKSEFVSFLQDFLNEQLNIEEKLNQLLPAIGLYCQTSQQYAFNYGEYVFEIPCNITSQGSAALVEYGIASLINKYYYAEYDCGFWNCFKESDTPLFLISEKAQDYWQGKFYLALLLSIVLAVLVFLLVEKKANFFLLTGSLMIVSAIPLRLLGKISSFFPSSSGEIGAYIPQIVLIFFSQSHNIFLKVLVAGIVFLVAGIILKIFNIGFAISTFFARIKPSKKIEKPKPEKKVIDKAKKKKGDKKSK